MEKHNKAMKKGVILGIILLVFGTLITLLSLLVNLSQPISKVFISTNSLLFIGGTICTFIGFVILLNSFDK